MGIFKNLFGKKKEPIFTGDELIEAGVCPNCWGYQEYDDKYVDFVKDQTKSNINHDKSGQKAFIQQFVETNITGIKLKNNTCPSCKKTAKHNH